MEQIKKVIASGCVWLCENMDLLAPITDRGIEVLFDDNTTEIFWESKEYPNIQYEKATKEEIKDFTRKYRGCIYFGDKVIIKRGRKMVGEIKEVRGGYRFDVRGTYGHQYTDYLMFTDGTKVNIEHCDIVGIEYPVEKYHLRKYIKKNEEYYFFLGGRL